MSELAYLKCKDELFYFYLKLKVFFCIFFDFMFGFVIVCYRTYPVF